MANVASRGLSAVLVDVLNWLKIYKQRAFWVQIGATVLAALLWAPFAIDVSAGFSVDVFAVMVNLFATVAFLCSIVTNIVWAGLRKSYSCVVGAIVGFGLYYVAWSVFGPPQLRDSVGILLVLLQGFLFGALFGYMAFLVFAISGIISFPRKRRLGSESSDERQSGPAEAERRKSAA